MQNVEDALDNILGIGDVVIVSRPSGSGSSYLSLCTLINVTAASVIVQPINPDGSQKMKIRWDGTPTGEYAQPFSVKKNPRSNKCVKVALYNA